VDRYAVEHPELCWEDGCPVSLHFADGYAAREGGPAEKRHVFLRHNDLPARWRRVSRFVIGETGFGTGLNFLLTWNLWRQTAPLDSRLHYVSVERYPLTQLQLARAQQAWPELATLAAELRQNWPPDEPGFHRLEFEKSRVYLTLLFGDVGEMLPSLRAPIDAWFLDGFAPARNPAMWADSVLQQVARLTAPGGTVATYTAAGQVRRGLIAAGFAVEKVPGFGAKREMLRGILRQPPKSANSAPWFATPARPDGTPRQAAVIGTGLAGTAAAYSLARRGWTVTLIEREPAPAQAASGNAAGVVMPLLAASRSPGQRWFAAAYRYALQRWRQLGEQVTGSICGVLFAAWDARTQARHAALLERLAPPPESLLPVTDREAAERCGLPVAWSGLYLPDGGWLHPPSLCRAQLAAAGDNVHHCYGHTVTTLTRAHDEWQLLDAAGQEICRSPVVVLANGHHAIEFAQTFELPLQAVRGQITGLAATPSSQCLQTVVCGPGYALPAWDGRHWIGATYDRQATGTQPTDADNLANRVQLARFLPALAAALTNVPATGRAAFRAVSPDGLPLVGPVPVMPELHKVYNDLQRGRAPACYPALPCHPGLYLCTGLGSRGLASAPLAAELLAAMLEEEPLPVPMDVLQALHPARFAIRALRKPVFARPATESGE